MSEIVDSHSSTRELETYDWTLAKIAICVLKYYCLDLFELSEGTMLPLKSYIAGWIQRWL